MNASNEELIKRFSDGTATEAELKELLRRIENNEIDDLFTVENLISDDDELSDEYNVYRERAKKHILRYSTRRKRLTWLAAAAIFLLTIVASLWLYLKADEEAIYSGKQIVHLADSSKVVLNENSELKVSGSYGSTDRTVYLTGEAFFEVKDDATKPFVVQTGKISTTVLGTEFNIKALPGQSKIFITVVKGSVKVSKDERIIGQLKPDQQIEIDISDDKFVLKDSMAAEAVEWQDDKPYDTLTMREFGKMLEQAYHITVITRGDTSNASLTFGNFYIEGTLDLDTMLNSMGKVMDYRYTINEGRDTVTLYGRPIKND